MFLGVSIICDLGETEIFTRGVIFYHAPGEAVILKNYGQGGAEKFLPSQKGRDF